MLLLATYTAKLCSRGGTKSLFCKSQVNLKSLLSSPDSSHKSRQASPDSSPKSLIKNFKS